MPMAAASLPAKPHTCGRTVAGAGMLPTRFAPLAVLFSPELQNSCLVWLVFHLLRPAALTDAGCVLELVRLCDILTFLMALLTLFFSFPLVGGWGQVWGCLQPGEAAVGEEMFVLRELPCAVPLLHWEYQRWASCPLIQFSLSVNEFL